MIISLVAYSLICYVMYKFGKYHIIYQKCNEQRIGKQRFFDSYMWTLLLAFSIFCGMRYNVGVDHLGYLRNYNLYSTQPTVHDIYIENGEYLFYYISTWFKKINLHFFFYFSFLAFIQIFFLYYALRKRTFLYVYIPFILIWGRYFLFCMNGIRQAIAICIFTFAVEYIVKKQYLQYVLCILLCTLFHKSAMILMVVALLPNKDIFKNRWLSIFFILLAFSLGLNSLFLVYIDQINILSDFFGYGRLNDYIGGLSEGQDLEKMEIGPRNLSFLFTYLVIILFSDKLKVFYSRDNMFLFSYNLMVLNGILYLLFLNTSHLFIRIATNLDLFTLILSAYLLHYFWRVKFKIYGFSNRFYFVVFSFIIATYLFVSLLTSQNVPRESALYKVFF